MASDRALVIAFWRPLEEIGINGQGRVAQSNGMHTIVR
jgi:hypothetical protein